MSESIDRRAFIGAAALTAAAAELFPTSAQAQMGLKSRPAGSQTFASTKQVDAGLLNIGYAEMGPPNGTPVILLHGWPYDIHAFVETTEILAKGGHRCIVPYLRGYGSTHFLLADTFRNAQQSAVALDIIALMDALQIPKAVIGGFDWGSRTAAIMAALWPERCKALVAVSGYLITNVPAQADPLPPKAELGWWYQYYFSTARGERGYRENTNDFNKLIWQIVSPKWNFSDATYNLTAAAFANPDHVAIVIHDYRWRLGLAKGEPQYDKYEEKLFAGPTIATPTITIASDFDGPAADGAGYRSKFTGPYDHRVLTGIGHDVPQEAPAAFAKAIVDADAMS